MASAVFLCGYFCPALGQWVRPSKSFGMSLLFRHFRRSAGLLAPALVAALFCVAPRVSAQVDQAVYDQGEKLFKANCGSCGNKCGVGQTCEAGSCKDQCPPSLDWCGACVETSNDPANCGAFCVKCPTGQICSGGVCGCKPGFSLCGAGGNTCIDTQGDVNNCGGCGQKCKYNESCTGGTCTCSPGAPGYALCSGVCTYLKSVEDCGACGKSCPVGAYCTAGACACPAPTVLCAGSCNDVSSDPVNCGACGKVCPGAQQCSSGSCVCPAGSATCDGVCANLETDPNHCGSCGAACSGGKICKAGSCQCVFGSSLCGGQCVATQADPANCGGCGAKCEGALECAGGQCGCVAGKAKCGTTCVEPASDPNNCGACGQVCSTGKICAAGSCVSPSCVLFSETFADVSQGWALGPTWQIGPAKTSFGHTWGFADPGTDHTASADNRVAGVVIGGNAPTSTGYQTHYLVSPPIDTTSATVGVELHFSRWLSSLAGTWPDWTATVEVHNGFLWKVVWEASTPVSDHTWMPQAIDLTQYTSSKLRVRFGYRTFGLSATTVSGWNIDDVRIVKKGCS